MNSIIILAILSVATLFGGVYRLTKAILPLVILGVLAALAAAAMHWGTDVPRFANMILFDNYAIAFSGLLMVLSIFIFLVSDQHYSREDHTLADIYALLLFTLIGGIEMAAYNNLTILFLGIETLSISLYILAGSRKLDVKSNEASLKYFMLGSFSTGFLLFGIALIYGATGTLELGGIRDFVINNRDGLPMMFQAGLFLMLVGLTFKCSAAPFHFWAPDVYQGSPTVIAAFMATVAKTAAFAALFRLLFVCFGGVVSIWFIPLWGITALTIIIGNLSAIKQTSVKRMLAYSSVSNAGYLMIGVLALNEHASAALFYYTAAYSLATISAFAIVMLLQQSRGGENFEHLHGMAKNNPLLAGVMILSMLSLAGIPPLAGFFGKYYLFVNAIEDNYLWIVVIAVLGSLVGVYYYFRVIVAIFQPSEVEFPRLKLKSAYMIALVLGALALLAIGIFPTLITDMIL
jgi:NADH-quinone oxidoreductase subunit N